MKINICLPIVFLCVFVIKLALFTSGILFQWGGNLNFPHEVSLLSILIAVNIAFFPLMRVQAVKQIKIKHGDIFYQMYHDELTKLPNRQNLKHYIDTWFKESSNGFSLILVNIDRFKLINDSYGLSYGDRVLQETALRLQKLLSENEVLIRYAGDEFIILTKDVQSSELKTKAAFFIEALVLPFHIGERKISLGSSIGIAKAPLHGDSLTLLLRAADIAVSCSKKKGNTANIFLFSMEKKYMHRLVIQERLRMAVEQNSFHLVYQPQFDTQGELYGVESLIRWHDEKLGFVPPDKFIGLAEFCGLMPRIGQFVIDTALRELTTLQEDLNITFKISMNVSAQQLFHANFFTFLCKCMERYNVDPNIITLEITESIFIDDIDEVVPLLNLIRSKGITISLDDFGTGYSSLSLLKALPVDELKIDKSFIDDINDDIQSLKMLQNIISIGRNLNLSLLAEGIENLSQKQLLLECGCDLFQDYYYSRPLNFNYFYNYAAKKHKYTT